MSLGLCEKKDKSMSRLWNDFDTFDPLQSMIALSNLMTRDFRDFNRDFNRDFRDFNRDLRDFKDLDRFRGLSGFNFHEDEKQFTYEIEIPGMSKEDIVVNEKDGIMTISGEKKLKKEDNTDGYHYVSASYGSFKQSFRIPPNGDKRNMGGKYENGVLYITIPKTETDNDKVTLQIE